MVLLLPEKVLQVCGSHILNRVGVKMLLFENLVVSWSNLIIIFFLLNFLSLESFVGAMICSSQFALSHVWTILVLFGLDRLVSSNETTDLSPNWINNSDTVTNSD